MCARTTSGYSVNKQIVPRFEGMLLEQVDKQVVQVWINERQRSKSENSFEHREAAEINFVLE
jgi:hypothetical protein